MSKQKCHDHTLLEKNLQGMSIYHPDGTINEEEIHEAARRHLNMLRSFVPEKTLGELQQYLGFYLYRKNWYLVAVCLSTYLGIAAKLLEDYVFRLATDQQAIRCYAERIALLLDEE